MQLTGLTPLLLTLLVATRLPSRQQQWLRGTWLGYCIGAEAAAREGQECGPAGRWWRTVLAALQMCEPLTEASMTLMKQGGAACVYCVSDSDT